MMNYKPTKLKFGNPSVGEASEFVFGREKLAQLLWRRLESGSLRILSERRMGKTWLIQLARAIAPESAVTLFIDAQRDKSAPELIWRINQQIHIENLFDDRRLQRAKDWFLRQAQKLQGQTIGTQRLPEVTSWSTFLEETVADAVRNADDRMVVLIIDELPHFLDGLIKNNHAHDAIRILDDLRALRHEHPNFRMLFCGSLGLHIVLDKLTSFGYTGQPVNDIPPIELPPLSSEDGTYLAGSLIRGEAIPCDSIAKCAEAIANTACFVPFYIQHIVKWMSENEESPWTVAIIEAIPEQLFDAHGDPAEFNYYKSRLAAYYPDEKAELARTILRKLCQFEHGLEFDALVKILRYDETYQDIDKEYAGVMLKLLLDDHYLLRDNQNSWRFKLPLVRRWWDYVHKGW